MSSGEHADAIQRRYYQGHEEGAQATLECKGKRECFRPFATHYSEDISMRINFKLFRAKFDIKFQIISD